MRRAAVFALRTARRSAFRKLIPKTTLSSSSHVAATSAYSTSVASMRLPKLPLAFVGTLGAIGAWYAYRGDGPEQLLRNPTSPLSAQPTRSLSTKPDIAQPTAEPTSAAPVAAGHESNRKALVVDNDQFFTGAIVGEGPLAKDTDDYGRKVLEMMTPEQATERLRKNEQSYLVGRGRGVVRYDIVQLPSNDPIEDDHAEKIVEVPNSVAATDDAASSDWMFWGVFDGHSGWTTSAKLRQVLISFAARELNSTYKAALANAKSPFPSPAAIDQALKSAFVKLDNEICLDSVNKLSKNPSKRLAAEILAPALSGSCALLSFYDSQSKTFRVACTGDSRAVLGRRNLQTGKWFATPLSEDQTGSNPNEEARMRAEHPGEDNVIRAGRVLGNLEPTRAFGDAFYKWSRETQDRIKRHFFGRTPHPLLKTPPYVTAEPVVTSTSIEPGKGDFVVLATDGLWEMLTNEEVVGLVGQWIEQQNKQASNKSSNASTGAWLTSWFKSSTPTALPVEKGGNMDKTGRIQVDGKGGNGNRPIRQQQWDVNSENNKRFVVEDKNAATHLVRNALGGRDSDMVCALLTLPSPYSRRYRDDLTVEVIFFGEGENSGAVVINSEATAQNGGSEGLKAKL
ncbi:[Pyruvate dehydrogenase [acetyl-transferring]]-phosphatase 1, mitochondrial [Exophiala xenobiotica]|uniref:[Pyruvate dehydrogenase [acetyl-transferring]]-phosphatase 1, mitochondrial n=1 Tax=Vermiconidia calcicola TaxID=1690605 RepID=A0AAV9QEN2_9PEZI|nr:[Pyruvate dehydrogenase [acetyl-transferring]]-phosphatase 1, mitochondrial [Exophiala xenobiotica]KAK5535477.1 [Pyruvate dehydrogenase [acetyl-transferring]]-phosphatase 1, mitochondrial [Chaetothyriales sp. CCFEE 6169]KAK5538863.1 [Pyruvate dehydrogenase [acetyl-transferring]]-phosphatase 1, mitochondrial [Vermiconidia calcicola]KAK5221778.1 [Pyruvate dehydrogenase [acetyl-transferring]]-phosphatase 1, mitochondrial [Exophiala xenobiotica]KAK5235905.1 [Pyruvate dehydrogenase [acetyl-transf